MVKIYKDITVISIDPRGQKCLLKCQLLQVFLANFINQKTLQSLFNSKLQKLQLAVNGGLFRYRNSVKPPFGFRQCLLVVHSHSDRSARFLDPYFLRKILLILICHSTFVFLTWKSDPIVVQHFEFDQVWLRLLFLSTGDQVWECYSRVRSLFQLQSHSGLGFILFMFFCSFLKCVK